MYKYSQRFSLVSFICCLLFLLAAFSGYSYWYTGFVFFIWLSFALLNYRHRTSLWIFKNKGLTFVGLYLMLLVIGFYGDYLLGQKLVNAWVYPSYRHWLDWARLYLIIYPFGGLSVLELFIFLGNVFKEKLSILKRPKSSMHFLIDAVNYLGDIVFIFTLLVSPIIYMLNIKIPFRHPILMLCIFTWVLISTIQLIYHFKNGLHWLGIFLLSVFMLILLHEIPNTFSFEWQYINSSTVELTLPILNTTLLEIPYWVIMGWYMMMLIIYKVWTHIDLVYLAENTKVPRARKRNILR